MFTTALFITADAWKPRCPLGGEWVNKLGYIQTWNIIQYQKKNFHAMKRQRGSLNAYSYMHITNLKKPI